MMSALYACRERLAIHIPCSKSLMWCARALASRRPQDLRGLFPFDFLLALDLLIVAFLARDARCLLLHDLVEYLARFWYQALLLLDFEFGTNGRNVGSIVEGQRKQGHCRRGKSARWRCMQGRPSQPGTKMAVHRTLWNLAHAPDSVSHRKEGE